MLYLVTQEFGIEGHMLRAGSKIDSSIVQAQCPHLVGTHLVEVEEVESSTPPAPKTPAKKK